MSMPGSHSEETKGIPPEKTELPPEVDPKKPREDSPPVYKSPEKPKEYTQRVYKSPKKVVPNPGEVV